MTRSVFFPMLAAALMMAPALHAEIDARPAVSVSYDHPEKFTETREVRAFAPMRAESDYLETLKSYIVTRAGKVLANGEHLQVVITDVDRAGSFEPWQSSQLHDVRIIKDIYPPRIDLRFRLEDASGNVIREGTRKLRDPGFLSSSSLAGSDDLRYEKNLIDRWLRRGAENL